MFVCSSETPRLTTAKTSQKQTNVSKNLIGKYAVVMLARATQLGLLKL